MQGQSFEVIAAIVAFVGFGGLVTLAGFIWKLSDRLRSMETEATTAKATAAAAAAQCAALQKDLSEFEVEASIRFATNEALEKGESRVIEAINRLADRLDRLIEGRVSRARSSRT